MRQSLLDACLELIRESGFEKLTLRQLANRVGVSQTAIYRHFADKDSLYAELASQAFEEILLIAMDTLHGAETASEKVRTAIQAYLAYAVEQPEKYRLMFGNAIQDRDRHEGLNAMGQKAFELLQSFIDEGQRSGEFDAGSSTLISSSSWASLHGYALFLIDGLYTRIHLEEDIDALQEQHIAMILKSLGVDLK